MKDDEGRFCVVVLHQIEDQLSVKTILMADGGTPLVTYRDDLIQLGHGFFPRRSRVSCR
jgi:hypothetical protein